MARLQADIIQKQAEAIAQAEIAESVAADLAEMRKQAADTLSPAAKKSFKEAEAMLDTFISWLIPFLCGGAVTFAGTMLIKLKAIKNGLQCLLRAEIIRSYDKYTERGYCPLYAKEALTRAYKAYHALGGNDVATELYHDIMELPTEPHKEQTEKGEK